MKRQTGKTTYLVGRMLINPQAVLITFCERSKYSIIANYPELQNRVVTFNAVANGILKGYNYTEVFIDQIDMCLSQFIGQEVNVMTADL